MGFAALPCLPTRLPIDNPLMVGVERSGVVDAFPGGDVPSLRIGVGVTFAWWRPTEGGKRVLGRIVGVGPSSGALPARVVLLLSRGGGSHEVLVFLGEVELWRPPRRARGAGDRLRPLVGDPLR
jgi:hypothetical protein